MAVLRDRPYARFNFLVDLGEGDSESPAGGFRECSPIAREVCVVEYRNGNEKQSSPRKLPGLTRFPDVTLRRGVIGSLDLWNWIEQAGQGPGAYRNIEIQLLSEDRTPVQSWRLINAFPVRVAAGPFDACSCEVAIEELTLAYETLGVD
jgi:phage tail-like protein